MSASSSALPRRRSAVASASLLLVVVLALFVIGPPAEARRQRHIAFAGLKSATTCIGGPVVRPAMYTLSWEPATEKNGSAFVYRIYQATIPGGENFSEPTYTTRATSFTTPLLSAPVYFVVRARDRAGNEDRNTVELEGQNLCE
jgi:hypothetical protein